MNAGNPIDPFWVLYLVNVLQPVDRDTIEEEAKTLTAAMPTHSEPIDVGRRLRELAGAELVISRSDGLYTATSLGLERLSQFKFGRVRDKNRLFILKKRFKER